MLFKVFQTLPMRTGFIRKASIALLVWIAIAAAALMYHANKSGVSLLQLIGLRTPGGPGTVRGLVSGQALPRRDKIRFLESMVIGTPPSDQLGISHLEAVDLDQDGLLDVVLCDVMNNRVSWIRQHPKGVFEEHVCGNKQILAPSHVIAHDIDHDGDLDLLVASLGQLFPTNEKVGSVVLLENDGVMHFDQKVVHNDSMRVADVRAGDLDGDGDDDLVLTEFGQLNGATRWLENDGAGLFSTTHTLQTLSGAINCPLADFDADGDLDVAVVVSQEWEEIHLFINDGLGHFTPQLVWGSANDDFGSSHLRPADLDGDGDLDLLYTNGDAWDWSPPVPRAWHGVHWLEQHAPLKFEHHRITSFGGPYSLAPIDLDQDGDLDIVVSSMFNNWQDPKAQSLIWLEQDGPGQFARRDITNDPTNIQALAAGDFDGDGRIDLVTGGLHTTRNGDRRSRVLLWRNQWQTR